MQSEEPAGLLGELPNTPASDGGDAGCLSYVFKRFHPGVAAGTSDYLCFPQ
jgi:hypothetical protein